MHFSRMKIINKKITQRIHNKIIKGKKSFSKGGNQENTKFFVYCSVFVCGRVMKLLKNYTHIRFVFFITYYHFS